MMLKESVVLKHIFVKQYVFVVISIQLLFIIALTLLMTEQCLTPSKFLNYHRAKKAIY